MNHYQNINTKSFPKNQINTIHSKFRINDTFIAIHLNSQTKCLVSLTFQSLSPNDRHRIAPFLQLIPHYNITNVEKFLSSD
jgi:hypothetical protein